MVPAKAQSTAEMAFLNEKIEFFAQKALPDSQLAYLQRRAALERQNDALLDWAATHLDMADLRSAQQGPGPAAQLLQQAAQQRWRSPRDAAEWEPFCYLHANLGEYRAQGGQLWEATTAYETAAALFERYRYPDFDAVEFVYKPLGNHYTRLGDNEKALVVFQKALALGGDADTRAGLHGNIGVAHWNQGALARSIAEFEQGLAIPGISNEKKALLRSGLAQAQRSNGDPQQAYRNARQALALLGRPSGNGPAQAYRARSLRTAGEAALALGRLPEAERLLAEALSAARAQWGDLSREVGKAALARSALLLRQGRGLAAMEAANAALHAVLPHFSPQNAAENPDILRFYAENTIAEALEAKAAAALWHYENTDPSPQWLQLALACHDLAWQADLRLRAVFQYHSSKILLQNNSRSREAGALRAARLLYERTGDARWADKALEFAERGKALLLREALQDNLLRQGAGASDSAFQTLGTLRQRQAFFQKNLLLHPADSLAAGWRQSSDALLGQIAALERQLRQRYPALSAENVPDTNPFSPKNLLETGEIALEYCFSGAYMELFILQKGAATQWQRLPNDSLLQDQIHAFLHFFQTPDAILNAPEAYLQRAFALGQALLPPAALQAATRLSIIPDGPLHWVPFEALLTRQAPGANLRNAAYLLRQQPLRYAWSLAVLAQQQQMRSQAEGYLLALAPGFAQGERGLAPLGASGEEWPTRNATALLAQSADLQHFNALAAGHRILHFSTHAFADTAQGQAPRIELHDQPLWLPELYALALQADLVVLSACQTGLGQTQRGEGVMSLARAFAQAGAASVLSSLWSVNDRSTQRLLRHFYRQLGANAPVASALRDAKLAYLDDPQVGTATQTPYFWAGLVLVGDDRPVPPPHGWPYWVFGVFAALLLLLLALLRFRGGLPWSKKVR
jgi:CHAT domain-containing protein